MQVVLTFSRAFWPPEFFDVVCTDCFIPEFWATTYHGVPGEGKSGAEREVPVSRPHDSKGAHPVIRSGQASLASSSMEGRTGSARDSAGADSCGQQSTSGSETAAAACLVGFAAGRRAEVMSGMSQSSIVLRALDQLDCIFGVLPCFEGPLAPARWGPG